MVAGGCFGFVVISHVVLVQLLRPRESLPNAVIPVTAMWTCVRVDFRCA